MKIAGEVKIGIAAVITIIVIIWGINYLKGVNILSSTYRLHAMYDQADGLEPSASVMLDGFKIGSVEEIVFETENRPPFTVILEIDKQYIIGSGSTAEIYSSDLLGTKAVRIIRSNSGRPVADGDTLVSKRSGDMISSLLNELSPLLGSADAAIQSIDSAAVALHAILNDPAISSMANHLDQASRSLKNELSAEGNLGRALANLKHFSGTLDAESETIQRTIRHLEEITADLDNAGLDTLVYNLNTLSNNLGEITGSMQSGEGTMGKLIREDSVYRQFEQLLADLDSLITDVNENPKKYVSFSLIGK